jgi:Flp pilus assembly protein TadD/mono/diheme cytochrome c family protein
MNLTRLILFSTAAAATLLAALPHAPVHAQPDVTWRLQIAPILYKNCTSCHHTGGSGPFPLTSYTDAKHFAAVIDTATSTRFMPPWLPEPGHGSFADARRLSDEDLALLHQWISAGSPEGSGPAPTPPRYTSEWQLGTPDLVLEMAAPIAIPASGTDLFTNVILPNPLKGTHWVRAMEIKPGTPQVVHHANVLIDRTASLRRTHRDWQKGIPGMDINVDSGDNFDPDSHFLFWKPDSTALVEPAGMPWRLDQGNDLVLNLHLKPTGKPETTRARIALYFTPVPAVAHPMLLQLEHDAALDIPAGDANFPVEDSLTLPVAVDVLGIYPHAHYLGHRMEAWATLPDGSRRDLILITDWDIDRQSVYRLAAPLALPAGTTLHMRYVYDNSAANVRNPHSPPIRVRAGNRSEDEMAHFWLQVLPHPAPGTTELQARQALEAAWMTARLAKSPSDTIALYNLAALALATNQPARAAELYRQLIALTPANTPPDPRALTALGSALQAMGENSDAEAQFRAALAADPTYSDAAFDLAALDLANGNLSEAESLLKSGLAAQPDDPEAHRLLAMTYAGERKLVDALAQLHAWQSLAPNDPDPHRALAQVYVEMGEMPEALREQQLVLSLVPNSASDWNDFGVMEAQAGNKQAARRDFGKALALDATLTAAQANLNKL